MPFPCDALVVFLQLGGYLQGENTVFWPAHNLALRLWKLGTPLDEVLSWRKELPHDWLGINCWQDIWHTRKEVVISRIRSLLGKNRRLYARQTLALRTTAAALNDFMSQNHLFVSPTVRYNYALMFEGSPVAMASFSRRRKINRGTQIAVSCELVRFASLIHTTVVGGLGKIIALFVQQTQPQDIMTYADRDWSLGKSYLSLGFEIAGYTSPQFFWVDKNMTRHHPKSITNPAGMEKVWNTGNIKFIKFLSQKNESVSPKP